MSAAVQCLLRAPAITSFYFDLNLLDVDRVYETIAAEFMNIFETSVHEKKIHRDQLDALENGKLSLQNLKSVIDLETKKYDDINQHHDSYL